MKDKRLDALLETIHKRKWAALIECTYLDFDEHRYPQQLCLMEPIPNQSPLRGNDEYPSTSCGGDIRQCEREG